MLYLCCLHVSQIPKQNSTPKMSANVPDAQTLQTYMDLVNYEKEEAMAAAHKCMGVTDLLEKIERGLPITIRARGFAIGKAPVSNQIARCVGRKGRCCARGFFHHGRAIGPVPRYVKRPRSLSWPFAPNPFSIPGPRGCIAHRGISSSTRCALWHGR